jgi:hypothetical protein
LNAALLDRLEAEVAAGTIGFVVSPSPPTRQPVRRVLALVGASGAGKTWLGTKLAPALGLPRLCIDDFGKPGTKRWAKLLREINATEGKVLVEACAMPSAYRRYVGTTVLLWAPPGLRKRRLLERGESRANAKRLVRDADRTPSRGDITVNSRVLRVGAVADLADRLAALGWVGGNPQTGNLDTARPAEKKVYGFPNVHATG